MARGGIILVEQGRVALLHRQSAGRSYYLFPGGSIGESETAEIAAARDALEELGLKVCIDRLVAIAEYQESEQFYFLASVMGGSPACLQCAETPTDSPTGSSRPVWLSLDDLLRRDVRPRGLADAVATGSIEAGIVLHIEE